MVIVAAIDDDSGASRVVEEASALADAFDEALHVVHVGDQYESTERIRRSAQTRPGEAVDTGGPKQDAEATAERLASAVTERFTGVGLVGYPADEILAYAEANDARYVVIGGRRRSPVGKAVFGSVVQEVVLGTDRPVVSVRSGKSGGSG